MGTYSIPRLPSRQIGFQGDLVAESIAVYKGDVSGKAFSNKGVFWISPSVCPAINTLQIPSRRDSKTQRDREKDRKREKEKQKERISCSRTRVCTLYQLDFGVWTHGSGIDPYAGDRPLSLSDRSLCLKPLSPNPYTLNPKDP